VWTTEGKKTHQSTNLNKADNYKAKQSKTKQNKQTNKTPGCKVELDMNWIKLKSLCQKESIPNLFRLVRN